MKKYLKSVFVLTAVCAVIAILLSAANAITYPVIEKRKEQEADAALLEVMPQGKDFKEIPQTDEFALPKTVAKVYGESGGGYVFELNTKGYAADFIIICGVDKEGLVTGAKCLSSNETNKAEITYGEKFKGANLEQALKVDTVASSTKTTTAYKNAIADAINASLILKGETVDLRSEEEKFADSLKKVLPNADKFVPEFLTNYAEGIKGVYKAENGAGYVFVKDELLVATDITGKVISNTDETVKTFIENFARMHIGDKITQIDIKQFSNLPASVIGAAENQNGNFVLELNAAGFGIKGDSYYNPSGEYIKIKVSITPDLKIIDCVTLSQSESENYGAACKDEKFYSQFKNKTNENYKNVDAVAGATVTTNGYISAIGSAFEAVNILKGAK